MQPVSDLCRAYVQETDVVFDEDFEHLEVPEDLFVRTLGSRREHPMNLNDNRKCLRLAHHRPSGSKFYYCYQARLKTVDRPLNLFKQTLRPLGFELNRLPHKDRRKAAFAPFSKYLPSFLWDVDKPSTNRRKDTFLSWFSVFYQEGSSHEGDLRPPGFLSKTSLGEQALASRPTLAPLPFNARVAHYQVDPHMADPHMVESQRSHEGDVVDSLPPCLEELPKVLEVPEIPEISDFLEYLDSTGFSSELFE